MYMCFIFIDCNILSKKIYNLPFLLFLLKKTIGDTRESGGFNKRNSSRIKVVIYTTHSYGH